jgi:hypothetical protein
VELESGLISDDINAHNSFKESGLNSVI